MTCIDTDLKILTRRSLRRRLASFTSFDAPGCLATDVYETADGVVVKMEIPGVEVSDIQVSLEGRRLVVQGNRRDVEAGVKTGYRRMEIRYGPFREVIPLPRGVDAAHSQATYKDGFLEIRLTVQGRVSESTDFLGQLPLEEVPTGNHADTGDNHGRI